MSILMRVFVFVLALLAARDPSFAEPKGETNAHLPDCCLPCGVVVGCNSNHQKVPFSPQSLNGSSSSTLPRKSESAAQDRTSPEE